MIPPYSRRAIAHRRRLRRLIRSGVLAAILLLLIVVVFFHPFGGNGPKTGALGPSPSSSAGVSARPTSPAASSPPASPSAPATPPTLSVNALVKGLPTPVSRAQAFLDGQSFLILGGLIGGNSSANVSRFFPVSDTVAPAGSLAVATHDAAAAPLGTNAVIFGGGEAVTIDQVQTLGPRGSAVVGHLPQARSDLVAAALGGRIYLLGGYDGKMDQPSVLVTSDGTTYQVVAQLPTPVRYAGVAVVGSTIYLIGGEHNGAQTSQIQAVDVSARTAKVVANLPVAISHEATFVLGGTVFIAGGRAGATVRNQVDVVDPTSGALTRAGLLPRAAADMAVGQNGNDVYLFGGESPTPISSIVHIGIA